MNILYKYIEWIIISQLNWKPNTLKLSKWLWRHHSNDQIYLIVCINFLSTIPLRAKYVHNHGSHPELYWILYYQMTEIIHYLNFITKVRAQWLRHKTPVRAFLVRIPTNPTESDKMWFISSGNKGQRRCSLR